MTIQIHVACDDEQYRSVIADYLDHQSGMQVVGASASDDIGPAAADLADPDVVVLGLPPTADVARQAPRYRQMMRHGAALVAFCMNPEQAAEYQEIGIERVILSDAPARNLTAAIRAAYSEKAPH